MSGYFRESIVNPGFFHVMLRGLDILWLFDVAMLACLMFLAQMPRPPELFNFVQTDSLRGQFR